MFWRGAKTLKVLPGVDQFTGKRVAIADESEDLLAPDKAPGVEFHRRKGEPGLLDLARQLRPKRVCAQFTGWTTLHSG